MRDRCLGVEAVLPCGTFSSDLSPLGKNHTGYDLRHLLIGSEGLLGIITAATLVVKPIDPETATVLCAVRSPADALNLYKQMRQELGNSISALELMSGFGLSLVTSYFPALAIPFAQNYDWYLLIEANSPIGIGGNPEIALAESFDNDLLLDAVVAQP